MYGYSSQSVPCLLSVVCCSALGPPPEIIAEAPTQRYDKPGGLGPGTGTPTVPLQQHGARAKPQEGKSSDIVPVLRTLPSCQRFQALSSANFSGAGGSGALTPSPTPGLPSVAGFPYRAAQLHWGRPRNQIITCCMTLTTTSCHGTA